MIGKQVFKHFNAVFQAKNVWLAYSNFLSRDTGNVGFSRPYNDNLIKTNSYRKVGFTISHLRAFYTKLFRFIKP